MQYGSSGFSKNGKPTMLTKDGKIIKGWEPKLSKYDVTAVRKRYNCA